MSSDRKRPLAVLPAALALVLAALLPLSAAAPARAAGPTPGQRIADALRTSPVYVDPAYASAVPQARQRQLAAQIKRTGLPIDVALVPLVKGDAFDGDPAVLADVVHDRLGQPNLILITMDQWSGGLAGHEWPDGAHQAQDAVAAVEFLPAMRSAGLADRVAEAIKLIRQGDGTAVYQRATAALDGSAAPSPTPAAARGAGPGRVPPVAAAIALFALLVLLLGGAGLLVRRRRAARSTPFVLPRAVFEAAHRADEEALRRHAEAEVLALGEAAERTGTGTAPGLEQALDAYQAARRVLDGARGLADLAGALALVTAGRDALAGHRGALPLCFFDPLHGRAERRIGWRPLGRRDSLDVAACAECARAVAAHRAPAVLTDTGPDGRRVPYFELPAAQSVWAATGYGSLVEAGGPDGLTGRVLRGDFSRTRDGQA